MPRKARIDAPGAVHHVIARGIEKRDIFWDDYDRNNFLERLGTIIDESDTRCYAWALLPNHCHLLFKTGLSPIATVMRSRLDGTDRLCRHLQPKTPAPRPSLSKPLQVDSLSGRRLSQRTGPIYPPQPFIN